MRIAACLSWYDERPAALRAWVAAAARVVDLVIAHDGAWEQMPGAGPRSRPEQRRALEQGCRARGIEIRLISNEKLWPSEVAKRAAELELASALLTPSDWILRLDADELVSALPEALRRALSGQPDDVGTVELHGLEPNPHRFPARRLLRALPGLTCEEAHYVACHPAGTGKRYLVGHPDWHPIADAFDLPASTIEIEHRPDRTPRRKAARLEYYRRREELQLEQVRR